MILVVDSGSTKTDWIALDNNGKEIFSTQTLGLNPQMLSNEILMSFDTAFFQKLYPIENSQLTFPI